MTRIVRLEAFSAAISLITLLTAAQTQAEDPPTLEWIRQFGTAGTRTIVRGLSTDSQGTVLAAGSLGSARGAYLRTYSREGHFEWSHYWQTPAPAEEYVIAYDVWADSAGDAYWVGGHGPTFTAHDPFFHKFDPTGNVSWDHEIPLTGNAQFNAVTGDGHGNIYIAGQSETKGFLFKSDGTGNIEWMRELTTWYEGVSDVAVDKLGNIYVSGSTNISFGAPNAGAHDGFLVKFNDEGDQLWTRQFGDSNSEFAHRVSTDGQGNVVVAGDKWLGLGSEGFVRKYDLNGNPLWNRQIGNSTTETRLSGVTADGYGNIYVAGSTVGSLGGANAGQTDAFARKYDASGNVLWTYQLGTIGREDFTTITLDGQGGVIIGGITEGPLGGPMVNLGGDGWIALLREYFAGDYNDDHVVDANDYQVWRATFGSTIDMAADGNRNAVIDAADYVIWRNNPALGNGTSGLTSVPEPASIVLLGTILASAATCAGRRRISDVA